MYRGVHLLKLCLKIFILAPFLRSLALAYLGGFLGTDSLKTDFVCSFVSSTHSDTSPWIIKSVLIQRYGSFMIDGDSPILTLDIFINKYCKFLWWMEPDLSTWVIRQVKISLLIGYP